MTDTVWPVPVPPCTSDARVFLTKEPLTRECLDYIDAYRDDFARRAGFQVGDTVEVRDSSWEGTESCPPTPRFAWCFPNEIVRKYDRSTDRRPGFDRLIDTDKYNRLILPKPPHAITHDDVVAARIYRVPRLRVGDVLQADTGRRFTVVSHEANVVTLVGENGREYRLDHQECQLYRRYHDCVSKRTRAIRNMRWLVATKLRRFKALFSRGPKPEPDQYTRTIHVAARENVAKLRRSLDQEYPR